MIPFSFEKARTEQDAIAAAAAGGRYIAGGTTLIDLMREEVERPERLIDINALPLGGIRVEGADLVIGALARMAEVAAASRRAPPAAADRRKPDRGRLAAIAQHGLDRRQPAPARPLPLFPDARRGLQQADPGLRLRRDRWPQCRPRHPRHERSLRRDASFGPRRRSGRARRHDAGAGSARGAQLPGRGALSAAGRYAPSRAYAACPASSSSRCACPAAPHARRARYLKVRDRASYEFALVSAAAALHIEGGVIREARLAAGGVGTRPWRLRACEEALVGNGAGPRRPSRRPPNWRCKGPARSRTITTRSSSCRGPSSAPSRWPEKSHDDERHRKAAAARRRARQGHGRRPLCGRLQPAGPGLRGDRQRDRRSRPRDRDRRGSRLQHARRHRGDQPPQRAPPRLRRRTRAPIDPAVGERLHVLQDDRVRFYGQPVAVVVADTLDQAERAAAALRITYEAERPIVDPSDPKARPSSRKPLQPSRCGQASRGDADGALASAPRQGRRDLRHRAGEPQPDGAARDRRGLERRPADAVEQEPVRRERAGGNRGHLRHSGRERAGDLPVHRRRLRHEPPDMAACHARRPRGACRSSARSSSCSRASRCSSRPATARAPLQRVALGATPDGKLTSLIHEGTGETSRYEQFVEALTSATGFMYSCPNVRTRYRLLPLDTGTPTYMRGPGEASGIFALECAMDELSYALGIDPIELRRRNEPEIDEGENKPFSSRSLMKCYDLGAERFGWSRRNPQPRSMRDGRLLIGMGVASAHLSGCSSSRRARGCGCSPTALPRSRPRRATWGRAPTRR